MMIKFIFPFVLLLVNQNNFTLKSNEFADDHYIPLRFTCEGTNVNPGFTIEGIPANTKTFAFIMDDTESPNGEFVHWVMWNIPPANKIKENSNPGIQGRNSYKENKYFGPCPPNGIHSYNFTIYALDTKLNLPDTCSKKDLIKAIEGHVISSSTVKGRYKKQS